MGPLGLTRDGLREFDRLLEDAGLSLSDLMRIAEANGIQILDKNGRLVAGSFEQLAKHLGNTTELLLKFGNSFSDAQSILSARNRIFEVDVTPMQEWMDAIALLGDFSEPIAAMFAGIDVSTEDGRKYARELLQRLFTSAADGAAGEFAGLLGESSFANINEFLDWLLLGSDALSGLKEATDAVTGAMQNVPSGFRMQQRWFEAQLADAGGPLAPPTVPPRQFGIGGPDVLPQPNDRPQLTGGDSYHYGDVYIDAREKPAAVAYQEWLEENRRQSRAIGGSLASGTIALE